MYNFFYVLGCSKTSIFKQQNVKIVCGTHRYSLNYSTALQNAFAVSISTITKLIIYSLLLGLGSFNFCHSQNTSTLYVAPNTKVANIEQVYTLATDQTKTPIVFVTKQTKTYGLEKLHRIKLVISSTKKTSVIKPKLSQYKSITKSKTTTKNKIKAKYQIQTHPFSEYYPLRPKKRLNKVVLVLVTVPSTVSATTYKLDSAK